MHTIGWGLVVVSCLAAGGVSASSAAGLAPGHASDVESRQTSTSSLSLQGYGIDDFFLDATDPAVERLVRYYTYNANGQATLQAWLRRAELYRPMVEKALDEYGLPRELLGVAIVESGLNPLAVSPVGATGLWQFMQTTGRSYGLRITEELDERRLPQVATDAAARHLRDLYVSLGDWPRALAAYNAGEERIQSVSDEVGSTNFWIMRERSQKLPQETAAYVPRVFAVARLLGNGEQSAEQTTRAQSDAIELVSVAVPAGVHLEDVASALGMQLAHLQRLNPELVGSRVPTLTGGNTLRIPKDRARLAELLLQPKLRQGKGIDRELLRRVSRFSRAVSAQRVLSDVPTTNEQEHAAWDKLVAAMDGGAQRTYRVRKGDSLHKIAKLFRVNEERLKAENSLTDPRVMQIGMLLVLPSGS